MLVLTNDFHRTRFETKKTRTQLSAIAKAVKANKAKDADLKFVSEVSGVLCPCTGCGCSQTIFGERKAK